MAGPIGISLLMRKVLSSQMEVMDDSQRENIFQTRCSIQGKLCALIIDGGSCINMASDRLVSKLNLDTQPHPRPYKLQWLSEEGEVEVGQQVELSFSIGRYNDKVLCDVVPMEASHILLGRPWQFDKRTIHDCFTNKISFLHKDKKIVLKSLSPSEVREDQRKMREKILQEKREKEKESKTLKSETHEGETLERQKRESLKRRQDGIANEREGKRMILAKQPLNLLNCGNQTFGANHFVNLKLFSSVKFFLQDFKDETTKETTSNQLPCLRRRRNVDIIPSAPLFTQPTFDSPIHVNNEDKANDCVCENTSTNQKLFVDDLFLCKKKFFHDLFDENTNTNQKLIVDDLFLCEKKILHVFFNASLMFLERIKFDFQRVVFDPGGYIHHWIRGRILFKGGGYDVILEEH